MLILFSPGHNVTSRRSSSARPLMASLSDFLRHLNNKHSERSLAKPITALSYSSALWMSESNKKMARKWLPTIVEHNCNTKTFFTCCFRQLNLTFGCVSCNQQKFHKFSAHQNCKRLKLKTDAPNFSCGSSLASKKQNSSAF